MSHSLPREVEMDRGGEREREIRRRNELVSRRRSKPEMTAWRSFTTTLALNSRCYFEALTVGCRVMRPRLSLWPDAWIAERRDPFAVSCVDAFACGEGVSW